MTRDYEFSLLAEFEELAYADHRLLAAYDIPGNRFFGWGGRGG